MQTVCLECPSYATLQKYMVQKNIHGFCNFLPFLLKEVLWTDNSNFIIVKISKNMIKILLTLISISYEKMTQETYRGEKSSITWLVLQMDVFWLFFSPGEGVLVSRFWAFFTMFWNLVMPKIIQLPFHLNSESSWETGLPSKQRATFHPELQTHSCWTRGQLQT